MLDENVIHSYEIFDEIYMGRFTINLYLAIRKSDGRTGFLIQNTVNDAVQFLEKSFIEHALSCLDYQEVK